MSSDTENTWRQRFAKESGLLAIAQSPIDTKLLCVQRFLRLFAYGASFLILAQFLSSLGFSDEQIGIFMTLTLLGDVLISFLLTTITDQIGRRRILLAGAVLLSASGVVFAVSDNYWCLLAASVLGVISPSGNEIGPFRAVEESILAHLTGKEERSDVFAWYTLFGTAGAALGTLTCGWMVQVTTRQHGWMENQAYRLVFVLYAVLGIAKLVLVCLLSPLVELDDQYQAVSRTHDENTSLLGPSTAELNRPKPTIGQTVRRLLPSISHETRSILYRLIFLFAIDSFASGMASPSWLTYFFTTIHSLEPWKLGTLFLTTNILATVSNIAALPLARRIGPLKTMVFTHLPSAVFLAAIPLPAPSTLGTPLAMIFLALRACTQSMDQAPRQAFLAAAVLPAERTAVLGVVNVAKTLAQAGGIGSSGFLAARKLWTVTLGGAGVLKALYDICMLWMFLGLEAREDAGR